MIPYNEPHYKGGKRLFLFPHNVSAFAQNSGVDEIHRIFVDNIRRLIESSGLGSQKALAIKAQMSGGFLSEILRGETSPSLKTVDKMAEALGVQPWELLADSEATRRAAIERMVLGPRLPDDRAAEHLPPAPKKEAAARKRKKAGDGPNPS